MFCLSYKADYECFIGTFAGQALTVTNPNPMYKALLSTTKTKLVNSVGFADHIGKELERLLKITVNTYIAIPIIKSPEENMEEIIILLNKKSEAIDNEKPKFNSNDETFANMFANIISIIRTYHETKRQCILQAKLKTKVYSWLDDLVDCKTIGHLMEKMEEQTQEIANCERANVVFFDQKRNEFYKRIRTKKGEIVKSFNVQRGLSALSVFTLSPILSHDVSTDIRFFEDLDDPIGLRENKKAKKVLAVPIVSQTGKETVKEFQYPRGAIVVINKLEGDFNNEDMENLMMYGKITSKVFDITTYFLILRNNQ